jgi:hypothetical protein
MRNKALLVTLAYKRSPDGLVDLLPSPRIFFSLILHIRRMHFTPLLTTFLLALGHACKSSFDFGVNRC